MTVRRVICTPVAALSASVGLAAALCVSACTSEPPSPSDPGSAFSGVGPIGIRMDDAGGKPGAWVEVLSTAPAAAANVSATTGDFALVNDRIRVVVRHGPQGVAMYGLTGGHLVDARRTRQARDSPDALRELALSVGLHVLKPTNIEVLGPMQGEQVQVRVQGVLVPFATLADALGAELPKVTVEHLYTVIAGSTAVEIQTTIRALPGASAEPLMIADVAFWSGDVQLFLPEHGTDDLPTGASTDAFAVTPAIHPKSGPQRIAAYAFAAEKKVSMINAGGILALLHGTLTPTAQGLTIKRWLAVGGGTFDDVAGALFEARQARDHGTNFGTVSGAVENAWPGSIVDALDAKGRPIARCNVDPDWAFQCPLPASVVSLRPGWIGDGQTNVGGDAQFDAALARPVKVTPGTRAQVLLQAVRPALVEAAVVPSGSAENLQKPGDSAFRLTLVPTGKTPKNHERTFAALRSPATFVAPPGTYDAWLHRGPFSAAHKQAVTLAELQTVKVSAALPVVVDVGSWASADFHVHAEHSSDSQVRDTHRVVSAIAEGLQYLVATDHDHLTDRAPLTEALLEQTFGAATNTNPPLRTAVGVESSTIDHGHFNTWPLTPNPTLAGRGAPAWGGKTLAGVFDVLWAPKPAVVQCNHPRFGGAAVFDGIDLQTVPTQTLRCNAIELINGIAHKDTPAVLKDWFTLLDRGVRITATGTSDCHGKSDFAGNPRTLIRVDGWTLSSSSAPTAAAMDAALIAGKAIATAGPLLTVTARSGSDKAEIGDTLNTAGKPVTIDVELQAPQWMQLGSVVVYRNSQEMHRAAIDGGAPDNGRKHYAVALPGPATPAWWVAVHEPPPQSSSPGLHRPPWAVTNPVWIAK